MKVYKIDGMVGVSTGELLDELGISKKVGFDAVKQILSKSDKSFYRKSGRGYIISTKIVLELYKIWYSVDVVKLDKVLSDMYMFDTHEEEFKETKSELEEFKTLYDMMSELINKHKTPKGSVKVVKETKPEKTPSFEGIQMDRYKKLREMADVKAASHKCKYNRTLLTAYETATKVYGVVWEQYRKEYKSQYSLEDSRNVSNLKLTVSNGKLFDIVEPIVEGIDRYMK